MVERRQRKGRRSTGSFALSVIHCGWVDERRRNEDANTLKRDDFVDEQRARLCVVVTSVREEEALVFVLEGGNCEPDEVVVRESEGRLLSLVLTGEARSEERRLERREVGPEPGVR